MKVVVVPNLDRLVDSLCLVAGRARSSIQRLVHTFDQALAATDFRQRRRRR